MNPTLPSLSSLDAAEAIVLLGVNFEIELHDLLESVTISQTYRNDEQANIEAVYTMPLPLDATLLDMQIQIGERTLRGEVRRRGEAQDAYEDAVDAGDSAWMLEESAPGLYTMNVGNLLPGEEARIEMRYARLLRWTGEELRIHVPSTIAPRYGRPHLQPHEAPEHTFAERRMNVRLVVKGHLAQAEVHCATHVAVSAGTNGARSFEIRDAVMDRDVVFLLREVDRLRVRTMLARDGEEYVALATFCPQFDRVRRPRVLQIVVDCSGSMAGDSIHQARVAVERVLDLLQPEDRFNLMAFGSNAHLVFSSAVSASGVNLASGRQWAQKLDANLGGTAMRQALERALTSLPIGADVLLITDGEVWEHDAILDLARRSSQRIFTVGVGSAPNEALIEDLARQTGGECEMVTPSEDMPDRISRQASRILGGTGTAEVRWSAEPRWTLPERPISVFPDDTVHAFAGLPGPGAQQAELVLNGEVAAAGELSSPEEDDVLARIAARERIRHLSSEAQKIELALRYRLVTPWTAFIVTLEREQKATTLPRLRKVRQTVAAGWHGLGVASSIRLHAAESRPLRGLASDRSALFAAPLEFLSEPVPAGPERILDLHLLGVGREFLRALSDLVGEGYPERRVVAAFLLLWLAGPGKQQVGRQQARELRRLAKRFDDDEQKGIARAVEARVKDLWGV